MEQAQAVATPPDPAPSDPAPPADAGPLRLRHCPDCGYDLTNLPATGRCPECGRAYDQEMIVLHGWADGSRANAGTTRDGWGAALTAVALFGRLSWRDFERHDWWGVGVALAVTAFPLTLYLAHRWTTTRPGLIQVRLNSAGCVQDDQPDDLALLAGTVRVIERWGWQALALVGIPAAWLILYERRPHWIIHVTFGALCLITIVHVWRKLRNERRCQRVREAMAQTAIGRELLPRRGGSFAPTPTPWSEVREAKIERNGDQGTVAIRIKAKTPGRWWRHTPVEAILPCTAEEASELEARIAAWRVP